MDTRTTAGPTIEQLTVNAYSVPTDAPEADGTFEWTQTTIVVVEVNAGGKRGLGYTYTDVAAATLIRHTLAEVVRGRSAMDVPAAWIAMARAVRNMGRAGIAASAIAAIDTALWDLKAKLLEVPLVTLLGAARSGVDVYGSGGFTSYALDRLQDQCAAWVSDGISRVKMKIGRDAEQDIARVKAVRDAIGGTAELLVDANGAYTRKEALAVANAIAPFGVTWLKSRSAPTISKACG